MSFIRRGVPLLLLLKILAWTCQPNPLPLVVVRTSFFFVPPEPPLRHYGLSFLSRASRSRANCQLSIRLSTLTTAENHKQIQLFVTNNHVLKRLVSTVRFCPSAPYPLQKPTEKQLLSAHSENRVFSIFQSISPEWLSKTIPCKLVPEALIGGHYSPRIVLLFWLASFFHFAPMMEKISTISQ